jgi:hypothetical protein
MTEHELDRLLADSLAAEPSPGFVARVREQVAAEPVPAWHRWWPAAAASVAVVALFVAGGWGTTSDGHTAPSVAPGAAVQRAAADPGGAQEPSPGGPAEAGSPGAQIAQIARVRVGAPPAPRGSFPEVLISPDDADAVRLLLTNAQEGVSPLAAASSIDQPMTVSQIDVPLIEVAPLAELTQLEPGERQ